jgi:predicted nucleic acid-binding protein
MPSPKFGCSRPTTAAAAPAAFRVIDLQVVGSKQMAVAAHIGYGHGLEDTLLAKANHISFGCFKARPRYQFRRFAPLCAGLPRGAPALRSPRPDDRVLSTVACRPEADSRAPYEIGHYPLPHNTPQILVDTGPWVALFDPKDEHHSRCKKALGGIKELLSTTVPVLTEAFRILEPPSVGSRRLRDFIAHRGASVWDFDRGWPLRAFELMETYADRPMDLPEASLIVAAEELKTCNVFTVDHDAFQTCRVRRGIAGVTSLVRVALLRLPATSRQCARFRLIAPPAVPPRKACRP